MLHCLMFSVLDVHRKCYDDAAWMIHIACQRTDGTRLCTGIVDVDLSPDTFRNTYAEEAGYPRLSTVTKPYIQKFLKERI